MQLEISKNKLKEVQSAVKKWADVAIPMWQKMFQWLLPDDFDYGYSGESVTAPNFSDLILVEDVQAEQLAHYESGLGFLIQINATIKKYHTQKINWDGAPLVNGEVFSNAAWPEQDKINSEWWHEDYCADIVDNLLQDVKVLQNSPLYNTDPQLLTAINLNFDGADLSNKADAVVKAAGEYLSLMGLSFSTKHEISPPPDEVSALSPWTIASDKSLESQFENLRPTSTHYIAFMLDETKSDLDYPDAGPGGYYLPVRYSPWDETNHESDPKEVKDWNDENFRYLTMDGDFFKPGSNASQLANGIELPHGLGVIVTEIINSKTGVWVGFIIDEFDPLTLDSDIAVTNSSWHNKLDDFYKSGDYGWNDPAHKRRVQRFLYTRPEYLRIKQDSKEIGTDNIERSALDPPISDNIVVSEESIAEVTKNLPPALGKINPQDNKNWLTLLPGQVALSYYSFIKQNHKQTEKKNYVVDHTAIINNPSLRYSEGYFYFVVGQSPRMSERDAIALPNETAGDTLEQKKLYASAQSIDLAKDKAWEALLKHFGKDMDEIESNPLIQRLKRSFFVTAASHVNINTTNPNNQNVLFAIRASYIDALPETRKPYFNDFDDTDFAGGRSFSFQFLAKEMGKICSDLTNSLTGIKKKTQAIKANQPWMKDAAGQQFNMKIIEDFLFDSKTTVHSGGSARPGQSLIGGASTAGGFPVLLSNFFKNQVYPRTTKNDYISKLISEAGALILSSNSNPDDPDHVVEIGIRDNGLVGSDVRLTISYILFSPDPKVLKNLGETEEGELTGHFKLFYHDPYITEDEYKTDTIPRSAVPLRIGIPLLRQNLEGVYPSMALHYLLSHSSILSGYKSLEGNDEATPKAWQDYLLRYSVPPIAISAHPRLPKADNINNLSCEELIKTLDKAGNVSGYEQRIIMERIYTNPGCRKEYYRKFKKSTPASDPEMTRKMLESKAAESENLDGKSSSGGVSQQLSRLYNVLLNTLDIEGIIQLLIACIQAKLGIPLTAEAICEAILIEIILALGVDEMAKALYQQAMNDPDNYGPLLDALSKTAPPLDKTVLDIKKMFARAPIASYMALLYKKFDAAGDVDEDGAIVDAAGIPVDRLSWLTLEAISVVKRIEVKKVPVQLVPAGRVNAIAAENWNPDISSGFAELYVDDELFDIAYGHNLSTPNVYTIREINTEKKRMLDLGYSNKETEALLVYDGYLKPKESQIKKYYDNSVPYVVGKQAVESKFHEIITGHRPPGKYAGPGAEECKDAEDFDACVKDLMSEELAKQFLESIKLVIDIQEICVMLVGPMLDGLEDLLRDPFGDSGEDWWDNFVEGLKRQFSFAWPTFGFPDNLPTVSHMGDYGARLLETILTLVVVLLGQILNIIIKEALRNCIEEIDDDSGPANQPYPSGRPPLRIPSLDAIMSDGPIGGPMPFSVLADLMDNILDTLSLSQLCSLLKGEASEQTLYNIMMLARDGADKRTAEIKESFINEGYNEEDAARKAGKPKHWSMLDIKNLFLSIAESPDFPGLDDMCDTLSPTTAMLDDVCTAFYDRDGKAAQLQKAGLTEKEAQKQIDQDLEDLKNKVMLYAPILFPNNNQGIGKSLNAIPDICDIPGAFSIPPGVQHTMELITDNILDSVKGSLIQDMIALRHFAVPSRAMMAVTNPDDLKKAHELFKSSIGKPYKKKAIAFIGNPGYEEMKSLKDIPTYPIIYGINNICFGGYRPGDDGMDDEYLSDAETKENLQFNRVWDSIEAWPSNIFEHEYFKPTTFLRLLANPNFYSKAKWGLGTGIPGVTSKLSLAQKLVTRALSDEPLGENGQPGGDLVAAAIFKAPADTPFIGALNLTDFIKLFWADPVGGEYGGPIVDKLRILINEDFVQDVKPKYLSEMLFEKDHLMAPKISGLTEDKPPSGGPSLNGFIAPPVPWPNTELAWENAKKVHSLNSTLKSIHKNPYVWSNMYKSYTGLPATEEYIQFEKEMEYFTGTTSSPDYEPISLKDREDWSPSGIIDTGGLPGEDYYNLANMSPGYYSLVTNQLADIFRRGDGEHVGGADDHSDVSAWWIKNKSPAKLLWAFMELTLGEAIGLTDERIGTLYPNFPGAFADGVILGLSGPSTADARYKPLYVVFDQAYMDPGSPLFAEPAAMISHFSANKDPVNRELFAYLSDTNNFPQMLGYINEEAFDHQTFEEAKRLTLDKNFNPNILKYDLPLTKLAAKSIAGPEGTTTINANETMQEIFKAFTAKGLAGENLGEAGETAGIGNITSLIEALEVSMRNDSLIYQNVPNMSQDNLLKQLSSIKDAFRIAKGKLVGAEEYNVPPGVLFGEESIKSALFDFTFADELDSDIQDLIKEIYDTDTPIIEIINNFEDFDPDNTPSGLLVEAPGSTPDSPQIPTAAYQTDPLNIRAQIFGQFLTYKFFEKYDKYKILSGKFEDLDVDDFRKSLKIILSTYCYSSLQFAYSNQMFAKLKRSRLQERGFMKKLWDKMLSSPLGENIPPVCQDVFDQFGTLSSAQAQGTNTDFFRIGEEKTRIIEFYKKSICKDVYAKNSPEENSVRVALLEGIVKLIVKIYTLEMCIASIIAWDSFEIGEIFATDFMTKVIVNNIKEDTEIEKISLYAKEIVKKEMGADDEEDLADKLKDRSALAYMVGTASDDIAGIIRDIFKNENYVPISTDLELEILYNSDEDFVSKYRKNILPERGIDPNTELTPHQDPQRFFSLHQAGIPDYVVDVRFKQNIYTMNYGSGHIQDLFGAVGHWPMSEDCLNKQVVDADDEILGMNSFTCDPFRVRAHVIKTSRSWPAKEASEYINMYGFNKRDDIVKLKKSKNFFHSMPYNYYQTGLNYGEVAGGNQAAVTAEIEGFQGSNGGANSFDNYSRPLLGGSFLNNPVGHNEFGTEVEHSLWNKQSGLGNDHFGGAFEDYSAYWDPAINAYKTRVLKNYYIPDTEQKQFVRINDLMRTYLGGADAFNKEMFRPSQFGNLFNGTFGNVTIEPYVRVIDYTEAELDEIKDNFDVNLYKPEGGVWGTDPCDAPVAQLTTKYSDYMNDFFLQLDSWRNNNIFNAYVYDFVPLSVWSHFYNEVFLKLLKTFEAGIVSGTCYEEEGTPEDPWETQALAGCEPAMPNENDSTPPPMKIIFDTYGLAPFFKEIKFGLRLSYSTTFPVDDRVEMANGYGLKEFMEHSFGRGTTPRHGCKIPAHGLKNSKTLFGHRPYYVESNDPEVDAELPYPIERFKICDEIQIPIVELEKAITTVPGTSPIKFTVEGSEELIPLEQLGFYNRSTYNLFDHKYWEDLINSTDIPKQAEEYDAAALDNIWQSEELLNQAMAEATDIVSECDQLWANYEFDRRVTNAHKIYWAAKEQFIQLVTAGKYWDWSYKDENGVTPSGNWYDHTMTKLARYNNMDPTWNETTWSLSTQGGFLFSPWYPWSMADYNNGIGPRRGSYDTLDYGTGGATDAREEYDYDFVPAQANWVEMTAGGQLHWPHRGGFDFRYYLNHYYSKSRGGEGMSSTGYVDPNHVPTNQQAIQSGVEAYWTPAPNYETWLNQLTGPGGEKEGYCLYQCQFIRPTRLALESSMILGEALTGIDAHYYSAPDPTLTPVPPHTLEGPMAHEHNPSTYHDWTHDPLMPSTPASETVIIHAGNDVPTVITQPRGAPISSGVFSTYEDYTEKSIYVNDAHLFSAISPGSLPPGDPLYYQLVSEQTPENASAFWNYLIHQKRYPPPIDTEDNITTCSEKPLLCETLDGDAWFAENFPELAPFFPSIKVIDMVAANPRSHDAQPTEYRVEKPGPECPENLKPADIFDTLKVGLYDQMVQAYYDSLGQNISWNPGPLGGGIGPVYQGTLGNFVADYVEEGSMVFAQTVELGKNENKDAIKHLTTNFHQFFYKNLAQKMVNELQATPEFRLMYEYLFPMKKYMSLSFMYASDSLSRFVPDPTDILDITKNTLFQVLTGIENSLDYTYLPDELSNFLSKQLNSDDISTQAKKPSMWKIILWMIIRTSLLVLKGFVEVTDPAIIIAKFIIDTINAIQQAVIGLIESGINTAKAAINAAKMIADSTLKMAEINISIAASTISMMIDLTLKFMKIPDEESESGFVQEENSEGVLEDVTLDKYVVFDTGGEGDDAKSIEDWVISVTPLTPLMYEKLGEENATKWDELGVEIDKAKDLQTDYINAKKEKEELEKTVNTTIKDMEDALKDAKKTMKEVFASPFLLPGMWAAMLPSAHIYGGGLMYPPLPPVGPPSTVPGMIYLVLLFLDGWEDMMHEQSQLANEDVDCEDYL